MTTMTIAPPRPDLAEIEALLYREADCLDRADLGSWLQLFTEDAYYWMPAFANQADPIDHISIIYDNRTLMEVRRHYLSHPLAPALDYPLRCSHIISNVRITDEHSDNKLLTVTSNFQAIVYYKSQTTYAGTYTHQLINDGDEMKIQSKRVDLINCDAPQRSIILYI